MNKLTTIIEPLCQLPRSREPTTCSNLVPHGSSPCFPILCMNHSNIIHPITPKFANQYLVTFPYRNSVCISVFSCARPMPHAIRSRISILCFPRGLSSTVGCCGAQQPSLSQFSFCSRHTLSDAYVCVIISPSPHRNNSTLGGESDIDANMSVETLFVTSKV